MQNLKTKYPPESAGRRMISNIPTALPEEKILDIRKRLFERAQKFETLNYIYIIDQEGKLVGVISLKEIFQRPEEAKIEDLMVREIVKAHPYTDQEKIAILALKYNLKSIPIVDKENRLLGIVPSDVILDILHSENVEDFLRFAGISKYNTFPTRILQAPAGILAKLRLPWLILGLFGGILAAQITNFFEALLKEHFILAAFIPLIVYMADAVGTQTETLFIRSLAIDPRLNVQNYLFREIKTGFLIAITISILLTFISSLWSGLPFIGFILGASILLTIVTAFLLGFLIPYLLNKFKKDPAIGSGPVGTIIRDVLSLVIYFSVASLMLKIF